MFDIGWSELVLIGVVVLIVIGLKELLGVLCMVGQWMGKVCKMVVEFQGQFQEVMCEVEMVDFKKSFDEVKEVVIGFNLLILFQKDVSDVFCVDVLDKFVEILSIIVVELLMIFIILEVLMLVIFVEVEVYVVVSELFVIMCEVELIFVVQDIVFFEMIKDVKVL